MSVLKRLGPLAVGLFLVACKQPVAPPAEAPDTRATDESAIRGLSKEWTAAAQAKDSEKFLSYYAEDAVLMLEESPDFTGAPAIREAVTGMMQDPNFSLSFDTTSIAVARSGDLATELSTYTLTFTDPKTKQPATQKGMGLTVWKKVGGQWKVAVDAPVSDPS